MHFVIPISWLPLLDDLKSVFAVDDVLKENIFGVDAEKVDLVMMFSFIVALLCL